MNSIIISKSFRGLTNCKRLRILWVSLVLWDYKCFCVSLLVCSEGIHWLTMLRLCVDILYVDRLQLSRSRWHGFGDW